MSVKNHTYYKSQFLFQISEGSQTEKTRYLIFLENNIFLVVSWIRRFYSFWDLGNCWVSLKRNM